MELNPETRESEKNEMLLNKNFNNFFFLDSKNFLMVNSLFGTVDILSKEIFQRFSENSLLPEEKKHFESRGYISNFQDVNKAFEFLKEKSKQVYEKAFFFISVSLNCNLNCPVCYQRNKRTNRKITIPEIERVFDLIKNYCIEKNILPENTEIYLFGGEPLLKDNFLEVEEIIKKSVKNGYKWGVITNGVSLEEFYPLFEKYKKYLHLIKVSLEGIKQIQDVRRPLNSGSSFDKILMHLEKLIENGFQVMITSAASRTSYSFLPELLELYKSKGWLSKDNFKYRIMPVTDHGYSGIGNEYISPGELFSYLAEVFEKNPEFKEKFSMDYATHLELVAGATKTLPVVASPKFQYCAFGAGNAFLFSSSGVLLHCARCENRKENEIIFSLENNICYDKINKIKSPVQNKKSCEDCSLLFMCGGGCTLNQLICKGLEKNCREERITDIQLFVSANREKILRLKKGDITPLNKSWID